MKQVHQVPLDLKEILAQQDQLVQLELKDKLDHLVTEALVDHPDPQEPQDQQAQQVLQVLLDHVDQLDRQDLQGLQAPLGHRDLQVLVVTEGKQAQLAPQERLAHWVTDFYVFMLIFCFCLSEHIPSISHQVQLVLLVSQAQVARKGNKVLLDQVGQQVLLAHLDLLVHQDLVVQQVNEVTLVQQDLRALRVKLEPLVHLDQLVHLVQLDKERGETLDLLVPLVQQVQLAPLVQLETKETKEPKDKQDHLESWVIFI